MSRQLIVNPAAEDDILDAFSWYEDRKRRLIPVLDFVRQQRRDLLDGRGFGQFGEDVV